MNVAATLTPNEASARRWPVVVVGAGPAGAVAAAELARRGTCVLLVDRSAFPRGKACGCCLNGRALEALAAAGLGDLPARLGAVPLTTFHLRVGGRSAILALPRGVAVSREVFDAALVRAAIARGADFLPQARTAIATGGDDERRLTVVHPSGAEDIRADVVLAADGLGGTLLHSSGLASHRSPNSRIGAATILDTPEPFYRPNVIYMTAGRTGYVGLVRLEDNRLDLACAVAPAAVRGGGGPGAIVRDLLQGAGWPVPSDLAGATWRGTPALTRQVRRVADHRLFALGDATGYVEPFTGEGMAWAISSAVAVADLAARPWRRELAAEWTRRHRRLVTRRQWACRAAAFVLRRPALAASIVSLLSWLPGAASPVVRFLNQRPFTLGELR